MLKSEFERIAGYEVTAEDFMNVIEPMYMATNLSKEDFVKILDKKRFAKTPEKKVVKIAEIECPNGTYGIFEAEVVDFDIKTGKIIVKRLGRTRFWAEICYDYPIFRVKVI